MESMIRMHSSSFSPVTLAMTGSIHHAHLRVSLFKRPASGHVPEGLQDFWLARPPEGLPVMEVQLGFHGGSTRMQGHFGLFRGACGCHAGTVPGSSWKMLSSLPDDGAPRAAPAARVQARTLIPLGPVIIVSAGQVPGFSHAARRRCRRSPAEMPPRAPRFVLAWTGDTPPIR
jgi:hypothetical protein